MALLFYFYIVDIYLEGSALLSHSTGVPPRDPHNDDIGDLIIHSLKTLLCLSLLAVLETVLLHREGLTHLACAFVLC